MSSIAAEGTRRGDQISLAEGSKSAVAAEGTRRWDRRPARCINLGVQVGGAPPNFSWAQSFAGLLELGGWSIAQLPLGAIPLVCDLGLSCHE